MNIEMKENSEPPWNKDREFLETDRATLVSMDLSVVILDLVFTNKSHEAFNLILTHFISLMTLLEITDPIRKEFSDRIILECQRLENGYYS